jgi:phospholipid/cholesterol/gamma-HCH transport system substrate-binding protein
MDTKGVSMSRHISETIIGAIVLLVSGYFFATAYQQSGKKMGDDTYTINAKFSDVTGVTTGSDVRVGGVTIGTVTSVHLDTATYQADIALTIRKDVSLPSDSTAAIVGESLLGGKFVALSPGGDDVMLVDGGEIEYTQSSVSLEQLLGKFVFSGGGVEQGENAATPKTGAPIDADAITVP